METITLCQRKGGTAKTTTALNLGAGLHRQGKRILFIDLDSQGNLSTNLRIDPESVNISAYEILDGTATAAEAIVKTTEGDLISASPLLSTADLTINGQRKEYRLLDALKPIRRQYDYIIMDTAPALGISLINALTASYSALITVEARQSSLDGLKQLQGTMDAVRSRTNKNLKIKGLLITRHKARTILAQDMTENLIDAAKALHTKVFDTKIRDCTALAECEYVKQSIFQYQPRSNGAKDYADLVAEILREEKRKT